MVFVWTLRLARPSAPAGKEAFCPCQDNVSACPLELPTQSVMKNAGRIWILQLSHGLPLHRAACFTWGRKHVIVIVFSCLFFRQEAVRANYRNGTLEFSTEAGGSIGQLSFADFSANGRVLGKFDCTEGVNTACSVYFYNATKEGIWGLFSVPQSRLTGSR